MDVHPALLRPTRRRKLRKRNHPHHVTKRLFRLWWEDAEFPWQQFHRIVMSDKFDE